jgi:hypothetical protein
MLLGRLRAIGGMWVILASLILLVYHALVSTLHIIMHHSVVSWVGTILVALDGIRLSLRAMPTHCNRETAGKAGDCCVRHLHSLRRFYVCLDVRIRPVSYCGKLVGK